ncbi:ABC transporter permease [Pyxidicoccus fallax]|uniref:ABC transporter permease n=1 Tax=Pyxidicoccus fallax TaxID=394095 RepID=A0A848LMU7_9BACT|nr:ABC transporter permease [Pyxidicoccus fallax]NMO19031.1 ABC transporter permease [Pyxidicoccus fallax]NPC84562.1 ABC transporter permease [Pyxidicoccus fallax]
METLLQDIRYALRTLAKSPGFTLVAVLALALGIGANSAVFSVVNGVLLKPPPFSAPDRLVHLWGNFQKMDLKDISVSVPEYRDYRELPRAFASVAAYDINDVTLTGGDTPERLSVTSATASFFPTLGVTLARGRAFTEDEETPGKERVLVLTDKAWRTRFAEDEGVLGRELQLDGNTYTVVGVLPPGVEYPAGTDVYAPLALTPDQTVEERRGRRFLDVIARLKPGMTLESARADMARVASEMEAQHEKNYKGAGWAISVKSLEDEVVGDVRGTLWLLLGAVGFVLLVACSSVANLLLARAAARGREVSIRAALGAGRRRLVAQFLTESLVLALAGGVLGLLMALWGTDVLLAVVGDGLPRATEVRLDVPSVLFTAGVSLFTGVLFGLVPALQASRADLNTALREGTRGTDGKKAGRLRSGLVVAQVALALVLLVGAGLFAKSLLALSEVEAGFTPEGVLTGRVALPQAAYADTARRASFMRDLLTRIQALPGVESVGATNMLPLGGRTDNSFDIEGRTKAPDEFWPAVETRYASADYLLALKVRLLQGRMLQETDGPDAPGAVVINKTFANLYWPQGNALGQRLKLHRQDSRWSTVVGIVDDLREWGLDNPSRPAAYYAAAQFPLYNLNLVVRSASGNPESLRTAIEAEVRALDGNLPLFSVAPMARLVDESIGSRRLSAMLMGLFAGTALLLAALGISGVIGYSVAQRTREMGIRMALGAARRDVLALVLGQGLKLAGLGVAVGLVLSLGLAQLLGALLYGVTAYDPWTFVGVAALLCGVAMFATWLPARRATRVDPIIALKAE